MSDKKSDDIGAKYLDGITTREEEALLFSNSEVLPDMEPWSTYVNQNRITTPRQINENILAAINKKKEKNIRYIIGVFSVAATIAILMTGYLANSTPSQMNYMEKEAALHEALSMFSIESEPPKKENIFYEDDSMVIYIESK